MATLAPRPSSRCRSTKWVATLKPGLNSSRAGFDERSTTSVFAAMAFRLPCPLDVLPRVHADHLAGDHPRRVGEQEGHDRGDVLDLGEPAQHRLGQGPAADLLG